MELEGERKGSRERERECVRATEKERGSLIITGYWLQLFDFRRTEQMTILMSRVLKFPI